MAQDHLFQEVVCMKLVQHPNIVRLYEVIDTPNKLYLILELGDGGDLYDYITNHGCGLDEKVARRYFRQIVTAIAYCHKLHVVHRDLKPENVVFFEKLGLVKLTDFGFSNRFTPGTHLDTACGSLAYSAPEILLGDPYDAPKVDIWSIGVILYMLVCGKLPFQEVNDSETVTKIMDCDYSIPDSVSPECACLIRRMLVHDPTSRAHMDDILQSDWLRLDNCDNISIELFSVPLVSRECLTFEDHMEILSKMSEGQLATVDEIQSILDRDEYNHIAATYFLLAERKLKRNYVEEFKRLTQQAQKEEKSRIQKELTIVDKLRLHNHTDVKENNAHSIRLKGINSNPTTPCVQSAEERVRRFSMILEDEEEEEEDEPIKGPSPFGLNYMLNLHMDNEYVNLISGDNPESTHFDLQPGLTEVPAVSLLEEEEEEELLVVANLASVRSDLHTDNLTHVATFNATNIIEHNAVLPLVRPGSRTSGSGVETSDGAESDASVTNMSVGGTSRNSPLPLVGRSAPPGEVRRKPIHRRPGLHHRPLISVRSSPQLLKHIAEENWNDGMNTAEKHRYKRSKIGTVSRRDKSSLSDGIDGVRSLRNSFCAPLNTDSLEDPLSGVRQRPWWMGQRAMSTTHSPTRTRRLFTSIHPTRPTSMYSWNAAFSMSLLHDFRRQSLCSSPVDGRIGSTAFPLHLSKLPSFSSQTDHMGDRRQSGPPSLMSAFAKWYQPIVSTPVTGGLELDVSCLDSYSSVKPALSRTAYKPLCNSATSPELENSDKVVANGSVIRESFESQSYGGGRQRSPTHKSFTSVRSPIGKSHHRASSPVQRTASWCSSAPHIYDITSPSTVSNPTPFISPSMMLGTGPREFCAPIREEEDEVMRSLDQSLLHNSGTDAVRRLSEASSTIASPASHVSTSKIDAESASLGKNRPGSMYQALLSYDQSGYLSRFTASNISLSSLAASLRDSRYMLDVVRGTFELQCHYNRRMHTNNGSIAGSSTGEYPSSRASASTSVRSLTAISENLQITTGLHSDLPPVSARRRNYGRSGLAHDPTLPRVNAGSKRFSSPRITMTGPQSDEYQTFVHDRIAAQSSCPQPSTLNQSHSYVELTLPAASASSSNFYLPPVVVTDQIRQIHPTTNYSSVPHPVQHVSSFPSDKRHISSTYTSILPKDNNRIVTSVSLVGFDADGDLYHVNPNPCTMCHIADDNDSDEFMLDRNNNNNMHKSDGSLLLPPTTSPLLDSSKKTTRCLHSNRRRFVCCTMS